MTTTTFHPAWWLPGPHLQTVGGKLLRASGASRWRRRRVETSDGDFLDLDLREPDEPRGTVLLLHGLEGSAASGYMRESARLLVERGLRAVALNFRSRGGEPNRLPRFYHSGETGDPLRVLRRLRREAPDRPLGALGFSLGGNVLLKLLGELGDEGPDLVDAAAAVSVPYDLAAAADRMERGVARLYGAAFLRSLKRSIREKVRLRGHQLDLEALERIGTLREFDDRVTAPLHGFRSAEDYYERCSSGPYLARIRVPTLLLHAADDPFLPEAWLPRHAVAANPALAARVTRRGGHLGWVAGPDPTAPVFWAERHVVDRLATDLTSHGGEGRRRGRAADRARGARGRSGRRGGEREGERWTRTEG